MCGNKLGSARTRAVSMRLLENTFPLKNRHFIWLCVSTLGHLENLRNWMTYKKTKKKSVINVSYKPDIYRYGAIYASGSN